MGKRDSRHHFTTGFSGNVVATEKCCRFYYFAILTSFNKITLLTFLFLFPFFNILPNPPTTKIKFAIRIKFNHNIHVQSSGFPQAGIKPQNLKFEFDQSCSLEVQKQSNQ